MRKTLMAFFAITVLGASSARAGDCAIRVNREALPGKQAEAHGPYGGRNPTTEVKHADSEEDCRKQAVANCSIKRRDILKSKAVNAIYDGKPLSGGSDLCK